MAKTRPDTLALDMEVPRPGRVPTRVIVVSIVVTLLALVALNRWGLNGSGSVDWNSYQPGLKTTIDQWAAIPDCEGLQSIFEQSSQKQVEDAQRASSGHGNEVFRGYLDDKMRAAGCYD